MSKRDRQRLVEVAVQAAITALVPVLIAAFLARMQQRR